MRHERELGPTQIDTGWRRSPNDARSTTRRECLGEVHVTRSAELTRRLGALCYDTPSDNAGLRIVGLRCVCRL